PRSCSPISRPSTSDPLTRNQQTCLHCIHAGTFRHVTVTHFEGCCTCQRRQIPLGRSEQSLLLQPSSYSSHPCTGSSAKAGGRWLTSSAVPHSWPQWFSSSTGLRPPLREEIEHVDHVRHDCRLFHRRHHRHGTHRGQRRFL